MSSFREQIDYFTIFDVNTGYFTNSGVIVVITDSYSFINQCDYS